MRLLYRLQKGTKLSDATSARRYPELFLGGCIYENPQENQVSWIFSEPRLCEEHQVRATTNNVFLSEKRIPR
jgi:hypothetical protein